jgi:signal transduction histidine kinase
VSLQRTIFLGIGLTVMATVALEALLDLAAERLAPLLREERLLWVDLFDAPLLIGVALVAASLIARRVIRPLRTLSTAAEELAREASPRQLPLPEGDAELARVYRAINTLSSSVQSLLARERAFTRYASHELRTPVAALKVQLERVALGHASAEAVAPALQRQVARIEELLAALLTLARARAEDDHPEGLRKLIQETIEEVADAHRDRLYVVEPLPDVQLSDAGLVRQGLRNLIDNALLHGEGLATVGADVDGVTLTLRVRDLGPGIPATELRRLSDPFAQALARPDGHGLGLALVALIARALDGRLLLHNTDIGLEASLSLRVVVEGG